MGGFPSGQRGQTVNLLQIASVVRIHLRPFARRSKRVRRNYYSVSWCGGIGRRKGLKIPRWQHRAGSSPATSSKGIRENRIPFLYSNFRILGDNNRDSD